MMSHSIRVARASCASLWSTVSLARRSTALGQRQITYLGAVTGVPAPGAFSRATTHDGMVYVSGTGGANDTGGAVEEAMTVHEECTRALEHVARVLEAAGTSTDRIVSATMLLSDKNDYAACNEAYVSFFQMRGRGGHRLPARSTALWGVPTDAKVAFSVVAAAKDATKDATAAPPVQGMRAEYDVGLLDESSCGDDPLALFDEWFSAAVTAKMPEPNALTLSTVDAHTLQPSSRVVLLKGYDQEGFTFFTNYASRKAKELETTPNAAMNFVWLPMERQIRIEGRVRKVDTEETRAYFHSRPRASQIGAWVSHQSSPIDSAQVLADREDELVKRFDGRPVPLPPDFWGGYRLVPTMIEFWQGRRSRLHDRVAFTTPDHGATWTRQRLSP